MRLLKNAAALICAAVFYIGISASVYALENGGIGEVTKCYELTTSFDKDNYCDMKISGTEISIEGKYLSDAVEKIELRSRSSAELELVRKDGGEFSAKGDIGKVDGRALNSFVVIYFSSGASMRYRVIKDGGWYFPDNGGKDGFSYVLDNIYDTQSAAWAYYISDEPDEETVQATLNEIRSLSDEITDGLTSDREKAFAVANWVSENIYYDIDARNNSVTLSTVCLANVLKERKTVCSGFANLYCALLEAQGIRAVNIKGSVAAHGITYEMLASSPQNHEWAAVLLDGRWAFIDVVWDTDNVFESGEYHKGVVNVQYRDITPLALSFDHRADRAEQRYYFRAMEYFEQSENSRQDFSFEKIPAENDTNGNFMIYLYIITAAAVFAVLIIIFRRQSGGRQ